MTAWEFVDDHFWALWWLTVIVVVSAAEAWKRR
jgi:hypothetical protein